MEFKWTGAKFDGSTDITGWLRKFKATLDAFGVEEPDRYRALVLALHEDVLTRVMTELAQLAELPPLKERKAEWLEKELVKRYAKVKSARERLVAFQLRKMAPHEDVMTYLLAKRELYLEFATAMKEDKRVWSENGGYFLDETIEGMPKELQFLVKATNAAEGRTFESLSKSATTAQGAHDAPAETATAPPAAPRQPGTTPIGSMIADAPSQKDRTNDNAGRPHCDHCGKFGHSKWQCRKLKDEKKRSGSSQESAPERKDEYDRVSVVGGDGAMQPYVNVEVITDGEAWATEALLDTGSTLTIISQSFAKALGASVPQTISGFVRLANGKSLRKIGRFSATLRFSDEEEVEHTLTVVEDVEYPLVLGVDCLKHLGAIVDYSTDTLKLPGASVDILEKSKPPDDPTTHPRTDRGMKGRRGSDVDSI